MISLLIVSPDKHASELYALDFCKGKNIDAFDATVFQPQTSLGIEDIRELQKKVFLKPLKSKEKALVMLDAHLATTEAQNALLKLLEEPPLNTYIILTAISTRPFLPTVLSRCKVIELDSPHILVSKEEDEAIDTILSATMQEKLFLAQELAKEKTELPAKLEALLHSARVRMLKHPENPAFANLATVLSECYRQVVTTNVNNRFLLEHAFLQIDSSI